MSGKKDTIHPQDLESRVRDEDENSKNKPLHLTKFFSLEKKNGSRMSQTGYLGRMTKTRILFLQT